MKFILTIGLFVFCTSHAPGPTIDYRKEFGKDYSWALTWMQKHRQLFEKYADKYQLPAKELQAIVFPELIRYNAVFDAIEVESLKYLYVTEGKTYADFSVGFLQMKPSFAEMVEREAYRFGFDNYAAFNTVKKEDERRLRVQRLCNTEQQLIYLVLFYKICSEKFGDRTFQSPSERIKFFATCYNAGYHRSEEQIDKFLQQKNFYGFNYADISEYYFTNE